MWTIDFNFSFPNDHRGLAHQFKIFKIDHSSLRYSGSIRLCSVLFDCDVLTVRIVIDECFLYKICIGNVGIRNKVDVILDFGKYRDTVLINKASNNDFFNARLRPFRDICARRIRNRYARVMRWDFPDVGYSSGDEEEEEDYYIPMEDL